jgi:hypothetical protein
MAELLAGLMIQVGDTFTNAGRVLGAASKQQKYDTLQ